jgi:hypothetical protein
MDVALRFWDGSQVFGTGWDLEVAWYVVTLVLGSLLGIQFLDWNSLIITNT